MTVVGALVLARTRESWSIPATPVAECCGPSRQEECRRGLHSRQEKEASVNSIGPSKKG
jgi:hypothetical protein